MAYMSRESDEARFKTSKALFKKFPEMKTRYNYCKIRGEWDLIFTFEKTQNGYGMATERIPAPLEEDLLALFKGPISISVSEYDKFKENEWQFLADKLLEKL